MAFDWLSQATCQIAIPRTHVALRLVVLFRMNSSVTTMILLAKTKLNCLSKMAVCQVAILGENVAVVVLNGVVIF